MSDDRGITFRTARLEDISTIVGLLAEDPLGQARESVGEPLLPAYAEAFRSIERDARNLLAVAEDRDGRVIGCLQITFIPGISYRGAEKALIEDVRIALSHRDTGLGRQMVKWALGVAAEHGCGLTQVFVHESRADALRYYAQLGFQQSHRGLRRVTPR